MKFSPVLLAAGLLATTASAVGPSAPEQPPRLKGKPTKMDAWRWPNPFASSSYTSKKFTPSCSTTAAFPAREFLLAGTASIHTDALADLGKYSGELADGGVVAYPVHRTKANRWVDKRDIEFKIQAEVLNANEEAAADEAEDDTAEKAEETKSVGKDELVQSLAGSALPYRLDAEPMARYVDALAHASTATYHATKLTFHCGSFAESQTPIINLKYLEIKYLDYSRGDAELTQFVGSFTGLETLLQTLLEPFARKSSLRLLHLRQTGSDKMRGDTCCRALGFEPASQNDSYGWEVEKDIWEVTDQVLAVRVKSVSHDLLQDILKQPFRRLLDWAFGPDGIPSLEVVAAGDFAHGRNGYSLHNIFVCKNSKSKEAGGCGYRVFDARDEEHRHEWQALVMPFQQALEACPVGPPWGNSVYEHKYFF
ncbi:hypothetical protein N0V88_004924 [Collariella sp. IMI 366227]|nr:hypothetical protein N0V88_004924 [Collariella sp. IMI 366227]